MKRVIKIMLILLVISTFGCDNDLTDQVKKDYLTMMVSVVGGVFTQTDGVESFSHTVSDFGIGKYEVSYDLWSEIYNWAVANGYTFISEGRVGNSGGVSDENEPVTMVSWSDAVVWCNAYSEFNSLTPVYYIDSEFSSVVKKNTLTPYVDWTAGGFRLPTEGEWEYAARNKGATEFNYASGATAAYTDAYAINIVAWLITNSDVTTHIVGEKSSNKLGIFDMSGNVTEWCWDGYSAYPTAAKTDFRGNELSNYRQVRGGGYSDTNEYLQAGIRRAEQPGEIFSNVGFRVAQSS